jgi:hypothetical protein
MPSEIFGVDGLVVLLFPVCFVLAVWALIDAAIRPSHVFQAAGQNQDTLDRPSDRGDVPVRPRRRCARNRLSDSYQAEAEAGGVSRRADPEGDTGRLCAPTDSRSVAGLALLYDRLLCRVELHRRSVGTNDLYEIPCRTARHFAMGYSEAVQLVDPGHNVVGGQPEDVKSFQC